MSRDPKSDQTTSHNQGDASNVSLNYRDAGVNIDAGNSLIERIKPHVKSTLRPGVIGGLGGFGALFEIPLDRYRKPILVSGTDGVGTKLKLAIDSGHHAQVGIDLVAMCVNDLIVQGAEPLFFLDYYATGKLDVDVAESVIAGICEGCKQSGAALIGGETAEMPGMYQKDDYDLAGFCVGIVERDAIIDGSNVTSGQTLIGLASSGPHSNGYSLIRKVIEQSTMDLSDSFGDSTLGETLLTPTTIYVKPVLELLKQIPVHAISHITGGGLLENIPRVMPDNISAIIDSSSWPNLPIFDWLQQQGNIEANEMARTFNCGIGMVLCVDNEHASSACMLLTDMGYDAWTIGVTAERTGDAVILN